MKLSTFKDAVQTSKLYCLNLTFSAGNHKATEKKYEQKGRAKGDRTILERRSVRPELQSLNRQNLQFSSNHGRI